MRTRRRGRVGKVPALAARLDLGLFRPKGPIVGKDVSGRVEAVGADVETLRPGDDVFGWCRGGLAEIMCVSEAALAPKPAALSFEQAAAVPVSGFTALQGLRDRGQIRAGHRVLINGAAGGVGTLAVQIAKSFGAVVTAVCGARNGALVRSIGADHVIDHAREDFAGGDRRYDLILDMIGNRSLADCRRALARNGTLVLVGGRGGPWFMGTDRWIRALLLSPFVSQRLRPLVHTDDRQDLAFLSRLAEAGKLAPVIDRCYPLAEVAQAIRFLQGRHARGKVVNTL
ncbi:MAG: NAD(P)-dependent alcohol dehydrogenase [Burkholderiales bacterium]|nr:MAG: NAD(P)-dependent alcohol dehydrogenase [Burkholderiales bacterium]